LAFELTPDKKASSANEHAHGIAIGNVKLRLDRHVEVSDENSRAPAIFAHPAV
jgi:hypothetical protein